MHRYEIGGDVHHPRLLCTALALTTTLCACAPQGIQQQVNASMSITSVTLAGGAIPESSAGCKGPGISPQISWTDPPPGTQSFALIMDDKDSIGGHLHRHYFVHWLVFDMPADKRELTAGLPSKPLPDGTQQGKNDARVFGYSGPCPDAGSIDHYAITVYALDTKIGLPVETTGRQLLTAIDGHILARGQIVGTYGR
jgi:Raf kinase inhibitor-like YbhB/YbcL family protein